MIPTPYPQQKQDDPIIIPERFQYPTQLDLKQATSIPCFQNQSEIITTTSPYICKTIRQPNFWLCFPWRVGQPRPMRESNRVSAGLHPHFGGGVLRFALSFAIARLFFRHCPQCNRWGALGAVDRSTPLYGVGAIVRCTPPGSNPAGVPHLSLLCVVHAVLCAS